jgi:hypothetical protein
MPARRTHVRATALVLAGAVNLLFVLLLLSSRSRTASEQVITAMIWLTPARDEPPVTLPPTELPQSERGEQSPSPSVESPRSESSTAISLPPVAIPPIDWYAEAEIAVRNAVPEIVRLNPKPSLDSKPRALVLPDRANMPHKAGDVEHREGGETITWINETCYYSNKPPSILFNPVPGLAMPTCKVRSMAERAAEKRAQEMVKEAQPEYLRRPLPGEDALDTDKYIFDEID